MSTAMQTTTPAGGAELALIAGDLSKLTPEARLDYYQRVCQSTGLNPFTQPFAYIMLNGKLTLYCRKDATDQLRKIHAVSVTISSRERIDDVYVVTARATLPDGRSDESIGAVTIGTLKGDGLANALMKAETKAKRRATLSICGLGWLDESETGTIPDAQAVQVDQRTGEIMGPPRRLAAPPSEPPAETPEQPRKLKYWSRLNDLVLESKARGLKVDDAERMQMAGEASIDEIVAMGRQLLASIDAQKAAVQTEDADAELYPAGRP